MKILVINCGSSSIKYRLFKQSNDVDTNQLAMGLIERIGSDRSQIHHQAGKDKLEICEPIKDYRTGIERLAQLLGQFGTLEDGQLAGVGHRVVHGAEQFRESVIINDAVADQIQRCSQLAPLHNPANLAGIRAAQEIFQSVPHVAVFDTAFFQTLEPQAYFYALPYQWYQEYQIRRYGFHGTSHRYVAGIAAKMLGKPVQQCNLITMHLGNGCSMAAVKGGRAVDTSMGLTPLEGLVMGTRCGDIDPAIIFYLARTTDLTLDQIQDQLEKHSGLLGISGVSGDMRDVIRAADGGNSRARLALEIFARRIRKYIGSYLVQVGSCDALVFTGGIGENSAPVRRIVTDNLEHLGIVMDESKNDSIKLSEPGAAIHGAQAKTAILVIPTNEELAIARDTYQLVKDLAAGPGK